MEFVDLGVVQIPVTAMGLTSQGQSVISVYTTNHVVDVMPEAVVEANAVMEASAVAEATAVEVSEVAEAMVNVEEVDASTTNVPVASSASIAEPTIHPFQCSICNKRLSSRKGLQTHMLIHIGEKKHTCDICDRGFLTQARLKDHIMTHNKAYRHKCTVCLRAFRRAVRLKEHLKNHIGYLDEQYGAQIVIPNPSCVVCKEVFQNDEDLEAHLVTHNFESQFQCGTCEQQFETLLEIQRHMNIHLEPEKAYKCPHCEEGIFTEPFDLNKHLEMHGVGPGQITPRCDECGKTFTKRSRLLIHMRVHSGERPFECNVCHKGFTQKAHLTDHLKIHSEERPYTCPYCPSAYKQKATMNLHIMKVHHSTHIPSKPTPPTSAPAKKLKRKLYGSSIMWTCEICNREYPKSHGRAYHMRSHTGERPFECDICNKKFRQSSHLKGHRLTHTGEKPYGCTHCGDQFQTRGNLNKHEERNHGSNAADIWSCKTCGETFPQTQSKKEHAEMHRSTMPYACPVCGKKFGQVAHLKEHSTVHSGQRPHRCEECPTSFRCKSTLKRHIDRKHLAPEGTWKCGICNKTFPATVNSIEHMKLHGNKPFKCKQCDVNFRRLTELNEHLMTHTQLLEFSNNNIQPSNLNTLSKVCTAVDNIQYVETLEAAQTAISSADVVEVPSEQVIEQVVSKQEQHIETVTHNGAIPRNWLGVKPNRKQRRKGHALLYQCKFCRKEFTTANQLEVHTLNHGFGEKCFKCKYCRNAYQTEKGLLSHMAGAHIQLLSNRETEAVTEQVESDQVESITIEVAEDGTVTMKNSPHQAKQETIITPHKKTQVTEESSFVCGECGQNFEKVQALKIHMNVHKVVEYYQCDVCHEYFIYKSSLDQHRQVHTVQRNSNCGECHLEFTNVNALKQHLYLHSDSKPYKCEYCELTFRTPYQKRRHEMTHKPPEHRCVYCGRSFYMASVLRQHVKVHSEAKRPYTCSVCSKGFWRKASLLLHKRGHKNKQRPYHCSECRRTFMLKLNLQRHIHSSHVHIAVEKCPICLQTFTSRKALNRHLRSSHSGGEPTHGETCHLADHMESHVSAAGKRTVNCVLCANSAMNRHQLENIHSAPRGKQIHFKCQLCNRKFMYLSSLTAHIKNHAGQKPYVCNYCNTGFTMKWSYLLHTRMHEEQVIYY